MFGRPAPRVAIAMRWLLLALALILLATAGWIHFRFGTVVFEQVVLHLPVAGAERSGNDDLVTEASLVCVGLPLLLLLLMAGWLRLRRVRRPDTARPGRVRRRPVVLPAIAFGVSLSVLLTIIGFPQFAAAVLADRSLAQYYAAPSVTAAATKPKNLVTIYLESGENTYADEELFGRNLLADLDDATRDWARFDGLQQYPGGGWTMAGLVGTQCGIPLKSRLLLAGINPNDFGEGVESYLPGATCLGDVLADEGYTNVFLGGAHTRFAGKDTFLADHGYQRELGLSDWEAAGEDRSYISVWGLSDRRLFRHAEEVIDDLRADGDPFNLSILTLDTHEPAGVFPGCGTDDAVAMATAITCSMRAVAGFIDHLEDEGYLKDTVVMVMGDHLKVTSDGGDFKAELEGAPDRTIIFRVWSPEPVRFNRDLADQFSVFPTTLDLLGFGPPNGQAGLGVSLVGEPDLTDTALELPDSEYRAIVESPSTDLYREFWREGG